MPDVINKKKNDPVTAQIKTADAGAAEASDRELVAAYLAGSEQALETLFERYRRPLYGYLNRMFAGHSDVADDVFQDTWVDILNALPKYRDRGGFSGWSFRIAHNRAMQSFRNDKIRSRIGELTDSGVIPENAGVSHNSPDHELCASELAAAVERAMQKLPPEQREVFALRRNGISFKEIAGIQRCPLNTALGRMRRVVMFLRQELADLRNEV